MIDVRPKSAGSCESSEMLSLNSANSSLNSSEVWLLEGEEIMDTAVGVGNSSFSFFEKSALLQKSGKRSQYLIPLSKNKAKSAESKKRPEFKLGSDTFLQSLLRPKTTAGIYREKMKHPKKIIAPLDSIDFEPETKGPSDILVNIAAEATFKDPLYEIRMNCEFELLEFAMQYAKAKGVFAIGNKSECAKEWKNFFDFQMVKQMLHIPIGYRERYMAIYKQYVLAGRRYVSPRLCGISEGYRSTRYFDGKHKIEQPPSPVSSPVHNEDCDDEVSIAQSINSVKFDDPAISKFYSSLALEEFLLVYPHEIAELAAYKSVAVELWTTIKILFYIVNVFYTHVETRHNERIMRIRRNVNVLRFLQTGCGVLSTPPTFHKSESRNKYIPKTLSHDDDDHSVNSLVSNDSDTSNKHKPLPALKSVIIGGRRASSLKIPERHEYERINRNQAVTRSTFIAAPKTKPNTNAVVLSSPLDISLSPDTPDGRGPQSPSRRTYISKSPIGPIDSSANALGLSVEDDADNMRALLEMPDCLKRVGVREMNVFWEEFKGVATIIQDLPMTNALKTKDCFINSIGNLSIVKDKPTKLMAKTVAETIPRNYFAEHKNNHKSRGKLVEPIDKNGKSVLLGGKIPIISSEIKKAQQKIYGNVLADPSEFSWEEFSGLLKRFPLEFCECLTRIMKDAAFRRDFPVGLFSELRTLVDSQLFQPQLLINAGHHVGAKLCLWCRHVIAQIYTEHEKRTKSVVPVVFEPTVSTHLPKELAGTSIYSPSGKIVPKNNLLSTSEKVANAMSSSTSGRFGIRTADVANTESKISFDAKETIKYVVEFSAAPIVDDLICGEDEYGNPAKVNTYPNFPSIIAAKIAMHLMRPLDRVAITCIRNIDNSEEHYRVLTRSLEYYQELKLSSNLSPFQIRTAVEEIEKENLKLFLIRELPKLSSNRLTPGCSVEVIPSDRSRSDRFDGVLPGCGCETATINYLRSESSDFAASLMSNFVIVGYGQDDAQNNTLSNLSCVGWTSRNRVIRNAPSSVILAKHTPQANIPSRYAIAVNESASSLCAVQAAVRLAKPCDVVFLFHVLDYVRAIDKREYREWLEYSNSPHCLDENIFDEENNEDTHILSASASVHKRFHDHDIDYVKRSLAVYRADKIVKKYKELGFNVLVMDGEDREVPAQNSVKVNSAFYSDFCDVELVDENRGRRNLDSRDNDGNMKTCSGVLDDQGEVEEPMHKRSLPSNLKSHPMFQLAEIISYFAHENSPNFLFLGSGSFDMKTLLKYYEGYNPSCWRDAQKLSKREYIARQTPLVGLSEAICDHPLTDEFSLIVVKCKR